MSLSLFDKRPPFVRFEEREVGINPDATAKEGRPIPRVIVMACITAHGSKDCHEAIAEEWIASLKRKGQSGDDYSQDCYEKFNRQFNSWKEGNELPREGTPVKTWAMCTREAANRLVAIGITTVEDLAAYPDTGLGEIGMDGRYLRDMARGWITEAKDKGANAKALADANVEIERLKNANTALSQRVDRLAARLENDDQPARRGRPPKNQEAVA